MSPLLRILCLGALAAACAPRFVAEDAAWREAATSADATSTSAAEPPATATVRAPVGTAAVDLRTGPPDAAELATVGWAVDDAAIETLRDAAWRPPKALGHGAARDAFVARSLSVKAAFERHRAARTRYGQVAWLADLAREIRGFSGELRTGAATPQATPPPRTTTPKTVAALHSRVVTADVELSAARLTASLLDLEAAFDDAYAAAVFEQRAAEVYAAQVKLGRSLVDSANGAYKAGRGDYAATVRARMRLDGWRIAHDAARERSSAARHALAAALELPRDVLDGVRLRHDEATAETPTLDAAVTRARTAAPDLQAARAGASRARWMEELAERQLAPDLTHEVGDGVPGGAGMRWGFVAGAPYLAEIRRGRQAAEDQLASVRRRVAAQAEGAWAALRDADRAWSLLRGRQIARSQQVASAALEAYRGGRTGFDAVDRALTLRLTTQLDAQQARRQLTLSAARLRRITGRSPTSHAH